MMTAALRRNERETPPGFGATLRAALGERFGARARFDEPLSRHTSFHIGGPADAWVDVESVAELSDLFALARAGEPGSPVVILGSGTNVLVSDRGVRGIVVHLGRGFRFMEWTVAGEQATVRAGAAVPFKTLVYDAVERGFTGLEFGEGIPGSLGGGLTMNAGAFGGEIGRVVERLEGVHPHGRVEELPRGRLAFEYRRLELPPGWIITGVRLRLQRGDAVEMKTRVATAREKRKQNQPLGFPNAGSIFRNPPDTFAGRLLEDAGVKGLERGGARVSERHANFIVNQGGATADDVRSLMKEMGERVYARSGILLQPEVKLVGEW
jgi:UDP-N-acetylmuramate dehydrogenase